MTTSALVPGAFDLAINGNPYMVDTSVKDGFIGPRAIAVNRSQSDTGQTSGENSLARDGLWRRSWQSLEYGAGQELADGPDVNYRRARGIFGAEVFDNPGRIAPGKRITQYASANGFAAAAGQMAVGPAGIYGIGGSGTKDLCYMSSSSIGTINKSTHSAQIYGVACDGDYVYASDGADIYRGTAGNYTMGTDVTSWNTLNCTKLWYVNSRLMAVNGPVVYNVLTAAVPSALFTEPKAGWNWTDMCDGPTAIYAAGYSGNSSCIYRFGLKTDGTALDAPVVAADFQGEPVYALKFWKGYVAIGTSKGFRLAVPNTDGSLTVGPYLPFSSVRCITASGNFVYAGRSGGFVTNDGTNTEYWSGLIKIDLTKFTSDLAPAWAATHYKRVATSASTIPFVACAAVGDLIVGGAASSTTGANDGFWYVDSANVNNPAVVYFGRTGFDLGDDKIAHSVQVKHDAITSGQSVAVRLGRTPSEPGFDASTAVSLGSNSTVATRVSTLSAATGTVADRYEVELRLAGGGPVVNSLTLFVVPVPARALEWIIPLQVARDVTRRDTALHYYDASTELATLRTLVNSGTLVDLQIDGTTYSVRVEDYQFVRYRHAEDNDWSGTLTVRLIEPRVT